MLAERDVDERRGCAALRLLEGAIRERDSRPEPADRSAAACGAAIPGIFGEVPPRAQHDGAPEAACAREPRDTADGTARRARDTVATLHGRRAADDRLLVLGPVACRRRVDRRVLREPAAVEDHAAAGSDVRRDDEARAR